MAVPIWYAETSPLKDRTGVQVTDITDYSHQSRGLYLVAVIDVCFQRSSVWSCAITSPPHSSLTTPDMSSSPGDPTGEAKTRISAPRSGSAVTRPRVRSVAECRVGFPHFSSSPRSALRGLLDWVREWLCGPGSVVVASFSYRDHGGCVGVVG